MSTKHTWTANKIGAAMAQRFQQRSTLIVPNCNWTGHEADLLVIDKSLRVIDVEIKISRADLKQDQHKDKWWHQRPWSRRALPRIPNQWPPRVWKHYYVLPLEIWEPSLFDHIPPASGVLALRTQWGYINVMRHAKPNKDAKPISPSEAINIARLASLRMWAALKEKQ